MHMNFEKSKNSFGTKKAYLIFSRQFFLTNIFIVLKFKLIVNLQSSRNILKQNLFHFTEIRDCRKLFMVHASRASIEENCCKSLLTWSGCTVEEKRTRSSLPRLDPSDFREQFQTKIYRL